MSLPSWLEVFEGMKYYTYLLTVGMKQDDFVNLLEKEPDFMEAKPLLQEAIERKGGRLVFGVKFHPELMMIESCYR